jgi:hypothetical protein
MAAPGDEGISSSRSAADRVWSRLPAGARTVLEEELSPTDLQTLQLDLARRRAGRVDVSRLRERWRSDRFVQPASTDPRRLVAVDQVLWRRLPPQFDGLALSPVTPLGTCAVVAPVDQNRVVSTVRSVEVVSDPTNVLALEAARRRRQGTGPVHLAACHRVLRNQRFEAPGALPHFELFTLVSSARDTGSGRTEADLLVLHLGFWVEVLGELLGDEAVRIDLTTIGDGPVRDRVDDVVRPRLPVMNLHDAPDRTQGIGYYATAAFKIMAGGGVLEIGDGGFTDWTAALAADAKERCLISCVSTERLTELVVAT